MSFSMSPPAQSPLPYSPYQNAASPPAQSPYGPPAKRQRLSPDERSPNGTPSFASTPNGLPATTSAYGNPFAATTMPSPHSPSPFAGSPQSASFHTPQPYQQQQLPWSVQPQNAQPKVPQINTQPQTKSREMMPPPPRPNREDERAGIDEIGDSLYGSGVDLKAEENYLHGAWNNRHVNGSFASQQSNSFGSSTLGSNSFNILTQSTSFGSQAQNGPLAGTMSQPRSQEDIENEYRRKREMAARTRAEHTQHHLNDQFLLANVVRNKLHKHALEHSVKLDVTGVYLRNPEPQPIKTEVMIDAEAKEGIVAVTKAESKVDAGVPLDHILSLVSLAAGERVRGLVGEAFGLARARKYGDHGRVVPPEFSDIATGEGKETQETVIPESVTGTSWDQPKESETGEINGETQSDATKETPQAQTISYQGSINAQLRELADRDRAAEREREKKREARRKKAESAGGDETTPGGTPAEIPAAAPPAEAAPPKMTKKELNKRAKEEKNNTILTSNATATHMAMGGKKSKYSWMTGGGGGTTTNRFARPAPGSGTATPKSQPEAQAATAATTKAVKEPTWGDWREDGVDGRGIQLRDWILVLEKDGREKKALQKAVNKLQ